MEPAHISAEDFVFKQQIQPLSFANNSRSKRIKANLATTPHLAKKRFRGTSIQDAGHQISRRSTTTPTPESQQLIDPINMNNLLPILKKHVIYIDTAIWNQQQLQQLAEGMGAKVQPRLDKLVGVYIIEPKENERLHKMASKASMNGIKCVSPNWIMTCYKEKKYHPPMNFPYELGCKSIGSNSQHHHYKLHLEAPSQSLSTSNSNGLAAAAAAAAECKNKSLVMKECDNPFGDEEVDFDYIEENQPGMQRKMDRYITRTSIPSLDSFSGPSLYSSAQQINDDNDFQRQQQQQQSSNSSSSYIPIGNLTVRSEVDEHSQQQRHLAEEPSQARREYFYNQSSRKEEFAAAAVGATTLFSASTTITTTTARRINKMKQVLTPEQEAESKRILEETQRKLDQLEAANKKKATKQASISKNTRSNTQEIKKRKPNPDGPSFGDGRMRIWYGNTVLDNTVPIRPYPTRRSASGAATATSAAATTTAPASPTRVAAGSGSGSGLKRFR